MFNGPEIWIIVIVLLVYLASQTLMRSSKSATPHTYSDLIAKVRTDGPNAVTKVVFTPTKQQINADVNGDGRNDADDLNLVHAVLQSKIIPARPRLPRYR